MADSLGEFSFKHTGNAYAKAADGSLTATSNWEGTATGYGTAFGTLTLTMNGGASSGRCSWIAQAFPEGQPWAFGSGDGTWEQIEGHHWKLLFPCLEGSDGSRLRCEGEIDLAARTFKGQMFDAR